MKQSVQKWNKQNQKTNPQKTFKNPLFSSYGTFFVFFVSIFKLKRYTDLEYMDSGCDVHTEDE